MVCEECKPEFDKITKRVEELEKKIEEYRNKFANPYITAERGFVDDVILPSETRIKLISAYNLLRTKVDTNPKKKHGNIPL